MDCLFDSIGRGGIRGGKSIIKTPGISPRAYHIALPSKRIFGCFETNLAVRTHITAIDTSFIAVIGVGLMATGAGDCSDPGHTVAVHIGAQLILTELGAYLEHTYTIYEKGADAAKLRE